MVEVRYRRIIWDNGNLGLIPDGWKETEPETSRFRLRLRPCDLMELPELIYPIGRPMPLIVKSVKKILAVYFRYRIKLILE